MRSLFIWCNLFAKSPAISGLSVNNNSNAGAAESRRPAAFRRGPNAKPAAYTDGRFIPATCIKTRNPRFLRNPKTFNPVATNARFSPTSGIVSQIVPNATRSRYCIKSNASTRARISFDNFRDFNSRRNATIVINATPTPARYVNPDVSSARFGFTTASASGNIASGE